MMQPLHKKILLVVVCAMLLSVSGFLFSNSAIPLHGIFRDLEKRDLPDAISYEEAKRRLDAEEINMPAPAVTSSPAPVESPVPQPPQESPLAAAVNLDVPFTVQAPYANWELPYQEACEEASVLMVARYKKGQPIASPADADAELKQLFDFQMMLFGYYQDTTAEETMHFANAFYGFTKSWVKYDFTSDDVKRELIKGNPVIVPAAGRLLPNPYFRQPGPLYHMLVIRGYTRDGKFITNDPGTRRGEEFIYREADLLNAVHDWNGGDVTNGRKVMIVLE